MLLDAQNLFSDKQSVAMAAGNALSTNVIDLGVAGTPVLGGSLASDIGRGLSPELYAQVVTTVTSGGAATLQVQLINADSADLATNPVILTQTDVLALATLAAGYQFRFGTVPPGVTKRYLGLKYIVGTATTTAGNVTAGIALQRQSTYVG
jgi:hypothetical protein